MSARMLSAVSRRPGLVPGLGGVAGESGGAVGLDLAGPSGDGLRVGSGVEGGLVAGELCVAVGDDGPSVGGGRDLKKKIFL